MRTFRSLAALLLATLPAMPCAHAVLPLRDQWQAACQALAAGQAARAHALFREFDEWYGTEAQARAPDFREAWTRLWGLAALEAGAVAEAVDLLEAWFTENPAGGNCRAFLRFQLAGACRALGRDDRAVQHWAAFLEEHPGLPECALVRWMWADLDLAASRYAAARGRLEEVLAEPRLPASGQALATAALAMIDLATGGEADALGRLRGGGDDAEVPPVLRMWRAVLAPAMSQQLLQGGRAHEACEVAQWFDLPQNLGDGLRQLLPQPGSRPPGVRQAIWNSHWQAQLGRLNAAVAGATTGEPALYALRLRSLLEAGYPEQALVLATALLASPAPAARELCATAHAAAIEACQQLHLWARADALADAFLRAFPQDPELPDILFLRARTNAARKALPLAIDQVGRLLAAFPGHPASRSWDIAGAGWQLDAGQAAAAHQRFAALMESAPAPWWPFLLFQLARCSEQLEDLDAAVARYAEVAGMPGAGQLLQEHALTSLLKIHLRRFDPPAFERVLARYRRDFPDGLNRLAVGLVAGSWYQQAGDLDAAVAVYADVAAAEGPAARLAHEQLSAIHRARGDATALRAHAIAWLRQELAAQGAVSGAPFADCLHWQSQNSEPALPPALAAILLEALEAGDPRVPAGAFLALLAAQWPGYRGVAGADPPGDFREWAELRALEHHRQGRWLPYAGFQLFIAGLLEQQGRADSADARRIQVLQAVPPEIMGAEPLYAVAATACAYDFPEADGLLQRFLDQFPDDPLRPEALFRRAARLRAAGALPDAMALLQEIRSEWADAAVHSAACLRLAAWQLAAGSAEEAAATLAAVLDRPGLPAAQAAEALLLRARADFQSGNPERGRLDCRRILTLYPAFNDIHQAAAGLLAANTGPEEA